MGSPPLIVLALVGPTASGKSNLAVRLARRLPFPVEIVSCDAFQVYRGLDIGSGKPPFAARGGLRHHLFDTLEPDDPCTAGRYAELAAAAIRGIANRGAIPLVVGGSGLYFRALRDGIFSGPGLDPRLRERLQSLYRRPAGGRWLSRLLARLDPESHRRIHGNDQVRRVRALEVAIASGEPISRLREERRPPLPGACWRVAGLDLPRPELDVLITARVRGMFDSGLVEEVRGLRDRFGDRWPGRFAIGYREVLTALVEASDASEVERSLAASEARIVSATRRYARRQRTWFRAEREVRWYPGGGEDSAVLESVLRQFAAPRVRGGAGPRSATLPLVAT